MTLVLAHDCTFVDSTRPRLDVVYRAGTPVHQVGPGDLEDGFAADLWKRHQQRHRLAQRDDPDLPRRLLVRVGPLVRFVSATDVTTPDKLEAL